MRVAVLAILGALLLSAPAQAAVSFTDIEAEVMCTVCGTPLNLAPGDAPFAQRERAYIRRLIAQGKTKQQIKDALVRQYGDEVLGLPKDKGFNLAAYLVPLAAVLIAAAALFAALGRWRRPRRPAAAVDAALRSAPQISAADARRLEEDLARFD